jgi:hypothetical protein
MSDVNGISVDEILMRASGRTLDIIAKNILAKGQTATYAAAWGMACARRPELADNYRPTFEGVRARFIGTIPGAEGARDAGELIDAVVRHRMNESPKAAYSAVYRDVLRDFPSLAQVYAGFEGHSVS